MRMAVDTNRQEKTPTSGFSQLLAGTDCTAVQEEIPFEGDPPAIFSLGASGQ
jgi:hypothetical protein